MRLKQSTDHDDGDFHMQTPRILALLREPRYCAGSVKSCGRVLVAVERVGYKHVTVLLLWSVHLTPLHSLLFVTYHQLHCIVEALANQSRLPTQTLYRPIQ